MRPRAGASCPTTASSRRRRRALSQGRHLRRPARAAPRSQGVAVHINAFNFPAGACWRSWRRRCSPACRRSSSRRARPPTWPSSSSAGSSNRGILPEGALQLISARPATCSTTSPARTSSPSPAPPHRPQARSAIRSIVANSVRFMPEPDSLNAALLGARRRAGHAGVRPLRQGGRPRDDGEGGPEMHRHPPRLRAARPDRRRRSTPSATAWPRPSSATRAHEGVRMGPLVSLDQRNEVRDASRARARGRDRRRRPRRRRRRGRRRREAAPSSTRSCSTATTPQAATRVHDVEAFGPCRTLMPYDDARRGDRARQARRGQPRRARSSPTTTASRARWCSALGAVPRPHADRQPRLRQGIDRPRLAAAGRWSTAARAAPAAARSWAASAACMHYMQRTALQGSPRAARRRHRPLDRRAPERRPTASIRSASTSTSWRSATRVVTAARTVTLEDIEHFAALHRRHLLRPHGRGRGQGATRSSTAASPTAT